MQLGCSMCLAPLAPPLGLPRGPFNLYSTTVRVARPMDVPLSQQIGAPDAQLLEVLHTWWRPLVKCAWQDKACSAACRPHVHGSDYHISQG